MGSPLLRGDCGTGGLELGDLETEGGPAGQAMGEVGRESIKGIFEAHNYNSQSGIHLIWVCACWQLIYQPQYINQYGLAQLHISLECAYTCMHLNVTHNPPHYSAQTIPTPVPKGT